MRFGVNHVTTPLASCPVQSYKILISGARGLSLTARGQRRIVEQLWQDLFANPSEWWDHRSEKANAKHPDFKHKMTQEGLWLDGKFNPPWVVEKLAALEPGALQSNVFSWNTRLARYAKAEQYEKTMELFKQMRKEGVNPNAFSFVSVIKACAALRAVEEGKHLHAQIVKSGWTSDVYLGSCLVDMYAQCGHIEDARTVFDKMPTRNVVCWSAMILGYVKCDEGQKALELSRQMLQAEVDLDPITFVGVLNACASVAALEDGRRVHGEIIRRGYDSNVFVCNSLVDMYSKCGSAEDAWGVFSNMPTRNAISWTAMIVGYVKCGEGHKALELSRQMKREGVEPDSVTFLAMLNACAIVEAQEEGRRVHEQIIQSGYAFDVCLGSSLVDMYAKCGRIEDAQRVFGTMPTHNVVSWNAMLGGYAMHGHVKEVLQYFRRMCQEGIKTDWVTHISLLSACSHAGLVDEGMHYFQSMAAVYNICARVEHYACIVDLLGRAGRLHEAEDLIKGMSCEPNDSVWMCLLSSCRVHGNLEMAERVAGRAQESDPENASGFLLLSNSYAAAGKWGQECKHSRTGGGEASE